MCSLGSCSRFWRELCGSDCVWQALCKGRWPAISVEENPQSESYDQKLGSNSKVILVEEFVINIYGLTRFMFQCCKVSIFKVLVHVCLLTFFCLEKLLFN